LPHNLKTIRDFIRWGGSRFHRNGLYFGHGTDNGFDEAQYLLAWCLDMAPQIPESFLDCAISEKERKLILDLFDRRIKQRIPAAYLTGEAWFCGLSFEVSADVLIPRSPIAELIEVGFSPWIGEFDQPAVLELCTGSGCIALAIAHHLSWDVDATDISEAALKIAQNNIERHQLSDRVQLIQSDLWERCPAKGYDLIISNPPYVSQPDLDAMPSEYRHEPELGLASGEDGLDIPLEILEAAPGFLSENGILVMELGVTEARLPEQLPQFDYLSLDFEHGGEGVILAHRQQLEAISASCRELIKRRSK